MEAQCGDEVLCTALLLEINVLTVVVVIPGSAPGLALSPLIVHQSSTKRAANSKFNMLSLHAICVRVAFVHVLRQLRRCTNFAVVETCDIKGLEHMFLCIRRGRSVAHGASDA